MLEQLFEICDEDQQEAFLDLAEEKEVRERIAEVQETEDELGNQVLGDLPQIVGYTIAWPLHPTEPQMDSPIGEELTSFIQERGELFKRLVREEVGGGAVTHRALYKVTMEWEEPLVMRDVERVDTVFVLEERLPVVQEEEKEPMVGPLELALVMLLATRMENPDLDYKRREKREERRLAQ